MKLTTRGRYAVTAMLDLAIHADGEPVALGEIAERQDISLAYLEQLFAKLRRRNLVESIRGPGGGYRLACDTSEISVGSVVQAVDETVDATRCKGQGDCQNGDTCLTHHLWMDLSEQIAAFLAGISLADLVERREVRMVAKRQDGGRLDDARIDVSLLN